MQKLHITVLPDPFKKKIIRKEKQRKYSGLTRRPKSLSRPDFPFRSSLNSKTEIVTCKLLLLKRPTISQFFQFRYVCGIFFLNHSAPPSKGELMPKAPTVQLIGM